MIYNKEIDQRIKTTASEIDRIVRSVPKRICHNKPVGRYRPVPSLTFILVFVLWILMVTVIYIVSRSIFLVYFSAATMLVGTTLFILESGIESIQDRINKKIEPRVKILFEYFGGNHFVINILDNVVIRIYLTDGFSGEPQSYLEIPIRTTGSSPDLSIWYGSGKNYHTICYYRIVINPFVEIGGNFKVAAAISDMKFKRLADVLDMINFISETFYDAYVRGYDVPTVSLVLKSLSSDVNIFQPAVKQTYCRNFPSSDIRVIIVDQYSGVLRLTPHHGHDTWKENRVTVEEAILSDFMWTLYYLRENDVRILMYDLQNFTIVTDCITYRFHYDKNPEKFQIEKDRNGIYSAPYEAGTRFQIQ